MLSVDIALLMTRWFPAICRTHCVSESTGRAGSVGAEGGPYIHVLRSAMVANGPWRPLVVGAAAGQFDLILPSLCAAPNRIHPQIQVQTLQQPLWF